MGFVLMFPIQINILICRVDKSGTVQQRSWDLNYGKTETAVINLILCKQRGQVLLT